MIQGTSHFVNCRVLPLIPVEVSGLVMFLKVALILRKKCGMLPVCAKTRVIESQMTDCEGGAIYRLIDLNQVCHFGIHLHS